MKSLQRSQVALLALACLAPLAFAHTDEDCDAFTWDLSREFAAMRAPATDIATPSDPSHAARIVVGTHYSATLLPQESVAFIHAPGRPARAAQPMAGVFAFTTAAAGRYRIALTTSHWVDILDGATVIESTGHEGRGGCALLHKVVEFDLPAHRTLTLQLSGQDAAVVGLIVSAA